MINYLEKFSKTNEGIVICNWGRGKGKTKAIIDKIRYDRPTEDTEFVIISPNWMTCKTTIVNMLKESKDIGDDFFDDYKVEGNKVFITANMRVYGGSVSFNKKIEIQIFFGKQLDDLKLNGVINNPKYIFMDNVNPFNINIDVVNSFKPKAVFIMTTDKNLKYIEDDSKVIPNSEWIDGEIEKLKLEYSNLSNVAVSQNKNNTITRQSILDMIINLRDLKNK